MIRKSLVFILIFFLFFDVANAKRRPTRRSHPAAQASATTVGTEPSASPIQIGVLLQFDTMYFGGAPQLQGNEDWRTGKPYLNIQFNKFLSFFVSYEIREGLMDDLFFQWQPTPHFALVAGQYSPVWGLVNSDDTSSLNMLELPLAYGPFSPTHGLGGEAQVLYDPWALTVAAYGQRIQTQVPLPSPVAETFNLLYSPRHTQTDVLAFDLAGWQEDTDGSHTFAFEAIPEIQARNVGVIIGTPNLRNSKNFWIGNTGVAWEHGPWSARSEYEHVLVNRADRLGTLNFDGYYAEASYFLTGESRIFSFQYSGYVGVTKVRHNYGAWELSTQFSYLNLGDRREQGGEERNFSLGLNWYPINKLKYQAVYIRSWATPNNLGVDQNSNFFGFRMQIVC